jgi:hypothetical protein
MFKRLPAYALLALAILFPATSSARDRDRSQGTAPWIHVEVLEDGGNGAKVHVNVPLSLAKVAMDMAPEDVISRTHVRLENDDWTVADIRRLWSELKKAGEAEFVTMEEGDESVRVFRKGERLFVHVDGDGGETVRVEVPLSLVDALLSGPEDELDLAAALDELQKMDGGEIVRVEDGGDLVRVWIE